MSVLFDNDSYMAVFEVLHNCWNWTVASSDAVSYVIDLTFNKWSDIIAQPGAIRVKAYCTIIYGRLCTIRDYERTILAISIQ